MTRHLFNTILTLEEENRMAREANIAAFQIDGTGSQGHKIHCDWRNFLQGESYSSKLQPTMKRAKVPMTLSQNILIRPLESLSTLSETRLIVPYNKGLDI